MNVVLMAHTEMTMNILKELLYNHDIALQSSSQGVSLTAIRTCYSHLKPKDIIATEGDKYFHNEATDGAGGTEADRLIRSIIKSKHTSTLEHINYTFAIDGVSRSLLAQLTRHRHMSFSVQSQRYVKMGSDDKSGGFEYVIPPQIDKKAKQEYEEFMLAVQTMYDRLRHAGVPAEDARMVLPNAATTNMVMTCNLRTLLEFYQKRKAGSGAQWEIAELAESLKDEVVKVDSWLLPFFE